MLAACTTPAPVEPSTTPTPERDNGNTSEAAPRGDRFGVGIYNTQEVADELRYIEENVQPLPNGTGGRRILITGSTAGIGQLTAGHLLRRGHRVVAHARDAQRAAELRRDLPQIEDVVTGDLLNLDETRAMAQQINALGTFDVIIHNAGEYGLSGSELLNANSVSPYLLTCLVNAPGQLIYLSSDQHLSGDLNLDELSSGSAGVTYSDSKLQILMLALAVARRNPEVQANAVAPGWVPTMMGFHNGPYAPDDLRASYTTQVWLAEGLEPGSDVTGEFFFHGQPEMRIHPSTRDREAQDELLTAYANSTGEVLQMAAS